MSAHEMKTTYTKVTGPRRKRRPRPYNKSGGALASSARSTVDPLFLQPWQSLFPARTIRRLRYNDSAVMTTTTGAVASYVLRANDLFDPDFTSSGHQPMGFDQMMVYFNHFTVLKSRIVVSFENYSIAASAHCVVRVDGDSTALTDKTRIQELGGLSEVVCEYKQTSGSTRIAELEVDIAKFQGVSRSAITADPSLQGSSGASPVEVVYFHLEIWNDIALSGSLVANFTIEYEAQFSEPRNPTQS